MARQWHTKRKRQKSRESGGPAKRLEMLRPIAYLSRLARSRFVKGIPSTDNEDWPTFHMPGTIMQEDVGQQEQDIAAAPRTTPKFIRPAPKSKSKHGVSCRGWSGSRHADGKASGSQHQAPAMRTAQPRGNAKRHQCKVWPAAKYEGQQRKRCCLQVCGALELCRLAWHIHIAGWDCPM